MLNMGYLCCTIHHWNTRMLRQKNLRTRAQTWREISSQPALTFKLINAKLNVEMSVRPFYARFLSYARLINEGQSHIHLIWPRPHLIENSSAFVFGLPVSYLQLNIFSWPTTDGGFIYIMNQIKWEETLGELRHPNGATLPHPTIIKNWTDDMKRWPEIIGVSLVWNVLGTETHSEVHF